jgi:peptidoglycan/xylan/chitin deacetylase (PgdA/CDA1 family)
MPTLLQRLERRAAMLWRTRPVMLDNPRPLVSFTFDDCPVSAVRTGASILEARGVRGTFYVCGGLAGTDWENGPQFTKDDLVGLSAAGHEIGCHTYSHRSAYAVSGQTFAEDLERNRAFLAGVLGDHPVETFAFPYGHVTLAARRAAAKAYSAVRGVYPGVNAGHIDLALLDAVTIPAQTPRGDAWLEPWIEDARRRNGWLILIAHDIAPDPSPYGATPETLAAAVDRCRAEGFEIRPVRDALTYARTGRAPLTAASVVTPPFCAR